MQTNETIIVIGALVLLTVFSLSLNSSIMQNQVVMYQSEQTLDALAVAQRYIEQAERLRFDEKKSATIPSSFTYAGKMGPDSGEQYPNFDDVDDYNGLSLTDRKSGNITYQIDISVNYVSNKNPDKPTSTRTYFKRMLVTVSSPQLTELRSRSVEMKRLFSYHYFYSD
jgi:hypothetical protein